MGWGEARTPTVESAGARLADAVRAWDAHRCTTREADMLEALRLFDLSRAVAQVEVRRPRLEAETGRPAGW